MSSSVADYVKLHYLSGKKDKKKKKKKAKAAMQSRVKIIDDNLDIYEQQQTIIDIENENEDAPQVVSVIDDRPVELRLEQYNTGSFKTIILSPEIKQEPESPERTSNIEAQSQDCSPPRRGSDSTPSRKARNTSPSRKGTDSSPPKHRQKERDYSPPRRNASNSLSRRVKQEDDASPPRRRNKNDSTRKEGRDISPPRKKKDTDHSPPRRRNVESSLRSPRRRNNDSRPLRSRAPESPSRTQFRNSSPPRRRASPSPPPTHKPRSERDAKRSRWGSSSPSTSTSAKATKTLDGKTAGLQNAKDLVRETEEFKKREAKLFAGMSEEVSGVNAATVVRSRKTGKVRSLEEEAKLKAEHQKKANALKESYDKWGKGLKQVNDYEEKLKSDVHEMNKPLARYADDKDLENYLKQQEREGDPMLAYIRSKKKKEIVKSGVPLKPMYEGSFLPNRYGIRPGYRWDGVDRSNGYERRWFEGINKRNAEREEAYKWNSEDM